MTMVKRLGNILPLDDGSHIEIHACQTSWFGNGRVEREKCSKQI